MAELFGFKFERIKDVGKRNLLNLVQKMELCKQLLVVVLWTTVRSRWS